jgi:LPXTG-motif cell wall-anchored protein
MYTNSRRKNEMFNQINQAAEMLKVPATGVTFWGAIIPAGAALLVLIVLFLMGKKKK